MMDSKLSLPAFLKMLSNNDVPMSKAMAVASKMSVFSPCTADLPSHRLLDTKSSILLHR